MCVAVNSLQMVNTETLISAADRLLMATLKGSGTAREENLLGVAAHISLTHTHTDFV